MIMYTVCLPADCFVLDHRKLFYHYNIVQYSYYPHIIITNYIMYVCVYVIYIYIEMY